MIRLFQRNSMGMNFSLCMAEIGANRVRTVITSFGIFLGVASLLVNMAFIRGIDDTIRQTMTEVGGLNTVTIHKLEPTSPQETMTFARSPGLDFGQVKSIVKTIPEVSTVFRSKTFDWLSISVPGAEVWGKITAGDPVWGKSLNYKIEKGRALSVQDEQSAAVVCIIGSGLTTPLFGETDPVGKRVSCDGREFEIVGIIKAPSTSERSYELVMPYATARAAHPDIALKMSEISLNVPDISKIELVQKSLEQKLFAEHRGVRDFRIETSKSKIKEMEKASAGIQIILTIIASISLFVGGVSIANIMFATIGNRIREIGVRKALGARNDDLFAQFLLESVLLSLVGGTPGLLVGTVIMFVPEGVFPYTPRLEATDFLIALGFILIVGLFSGIFPARKAAQMKPVEALRF